jgi:hypothetical protein
VEKVLSFCFDKSESFKSESTQPRPAQTPLNRSQCSKQCINRLKHLYVNQNLLLSLSLIVDLVEDDAALSM